VERLEQTNNQIAAKLMELVVINKLLMEKVGLTQDEIKAEAERLRSGKSKVEET